MPERRVAYLDGDTSPDLFLYDVKSGAWTERTGSGNFSATWAPGSELYVSDLNGDRRDDLVLYNRTTGQWVQAINTGGGAFTYGSGTWSPGLTILAGMTRLP